MVSEYEGENWVTQYRAALIELEHNKIAGRIEAARTEIRARVEKLRTIPGLHTDERQAIEDALCGLHALTQEEARCDADHKRLVLNNASETSRSIAPPAPNSQNEDSE
jgi:hypothetical protein